MRIFWKNGAFTFIELMFVVVIVGILAGLAVPRFSHTIEKSRTAEAINILQTLRDAQEVYRLENGVYTAIRGNLDVTIPASRNFNAPTVALVGGSPIASVQRGAAGYNYTLTIDIDGTVKCAGGAPANICARLGCAGGAGSDQCN